MELKITIFLLNILNLVNQLTGNSDNQIVRSHRKPKFFFPPLFLPLRRGKISQEFVTTTQIPPPMPNCVNCNPGTSDSLCGYPDYISGILPGFPIFPGFNVTHDQYRICTTNYGVFDSMCIFKCHRMCNPNLTLVGATCGKEYADESEAGLAANCTFRPCVISKL